MIVEGKFKPFADELYDQNRKLRNKKGCALSPDDIITMDWLLDNVVGVIPDLDDLEESARAIVMNQGVMQE